MIIKYLANIFFVFNINVLRYWNLASTVDKLIRKKTQNNMCSYKQKDLREYIITQSWATSS